VAQEIINATVLAGSVAVSAGGVGVAASGSGVSAVNKVATEVQSFSEDCAAIVAGSVALSADDTSLIKADAGAAAVAASFAGVGVALSIGAAVAENQISNEIESHIARAGSLTSVGDITLHAAESATITSRTAAAAVSAAVGAIGVAVSGAGATATNVILTATNAYLDGSTVVGANNVTLEATNSSTINATVLSVAASLGGGIVGLSGSIGASTARNLIGSTISGAPSPEQVQTYVKNSAIRATGDLVQTANAVQTIDATVMAASVAVSAGLVAGAASGAGATTVNKVATQVTSFIDNSGVTGVVVSAGNVTLTAHDTSTITATVGAASMAAAVGLTGAAVSIGVSGASNDIGNEVAAYIRSATVTATSGDLTVRALEDTTITTTAVAASAAAATGTFSLAISGGGAAALNTIHNSTKAFSADSTLKLPGDLTVEANDTSTSSAKVDTLSSSTGILSLSMGGSVANTTITSSIAAYAGATGIDVGGSILVSATATPKASVWALGVNSGTLAVGLSSASATVTPTVTAYVGGSNKTLKAGSLAVLASLAAPDGGYSAYSYASGSAGALIGITATSAVASNSGVVAGYIADNATLVIAGSTLVAATSNTRQLAEADSHVVGLIAAGTTNAGAASALSTKAWLGSSVKLTGGSLAVTATGSDDNFALATAGSGGLIAGAAATARTLNISTTTAGVKNGAVLDLTGGGTGSASLAADHSAVFNTQVLTAAGGALAGSGAETSNTVVSDVEVNLGADASMSARDISLLAYSRAIKPMLSDYNISGTTGGIVSGAGADSTTTISLTTLATVGDRAKLTVVAGGTGVAGALALKTRNDLDVNDQVKLTTGGALAGAGANVTISAPVDLSKIQIGTGAALSSAGDVILSARGGATADAEVNAETYGVATVAVAYSTLDLAHVVNLVSIGAGSTIHAGGDLELSAGTDTDFNRDQYTLTARTDTFAGSAIPIDKVDALVHLVQNNQIVISGGALLETAGDAKLFAEKLGLVDITAKAKATNWMSMLADAINGGSSEIAYKGTFDAKAYGTVQNDGTVRTGLDRHKSLTLDSWNSATGTVSGTSIGGIEFTTGITAVTSGLFADLQTLQTNLSNYINAGNATLVTYYQTQIARVQAEMITQGLMTKLPDNGTNGVQKKDGQGNLLWIYMPIQRYAMTVNVLPAVAQAGVIDVRADLLVGSGVMDAPGDASISIINNTPAYLNILGLAIPETNGGLLLNGQVAGTNAAITTINAGNDDGRPGTAAFSSITLAGAGNQPTITIKNLAWNPAGHAGEIYAYPDISIIGDIINLGGAFIDNAGAGSIMISKNATIQSKTQEISAGGSVVIADLTTYNVGGDPYAQWQAATNALWAIASPVVGQAYTASAANIASAVNNSISTPSLYANSITITAEYINVNGLIQSGKADYTLTLTTATTNEINAIIKNHQVGLIQLTSAISSDFKVYFDTATQTIQVQEVYSKGGSIELHGNVMNSGTGQISVLGGYSNVTITNATQWDLLVNRIDVSSRGAGTLLIDDTAKKQTTLYTIDSTGKMLTQSTPFTVDSTGKRVFGVTTSSLPTDSWNTTFAPQTGWRYAWASAKQTAENRYATVASSSWAGIDALAADPAAIVWDRTENITQPTLVPSSNYYFQSDALKDVAFTATYKDLTLSHQPVREIAHWQDTNWCGVTTYSSTLLEESSHKDIWNYSVKADRSINIGFIGNSEGKITLNSTGAGKIELAGAILNSSGTTTISSLKSIVQTNESASVGGRAIKLTAGTGIGTGSTAISINESDLATASLSATTASGDINLNGVSGSLALDQVVASKGNVTLSAQIGIAATGATLATGGSGKAMLVKGGSVTLTANGGGIGAGGRTVVLDSGMTLSDKVTATATGDISLKETVGDLRLYQATSSSGDVTLKIVEGSLINANTNVVRDDRTYDELANGLWTNMQLTAATGAQGKVDAILASYQALKESEYRTYWQYRASQPDGGVNFDPSFVVHLSAEELTYYKDYYATQGLTTVQITDAITTLEASRTQQYRTLNTQFSDYFTANSKAFPSSYDAAFTYHLSTAETTSLTGSIKVWTDDELLYGFGSGMLKKVTSTTVNIEDPCIIARNITIDSHVGVGVASGKLVIDASHGFGSMTTDQRVALAAAERVDVTFYNGTTVVEDASVAGTVITSIVINQVKDLPVSATGAVSITAVKDIFLGSQGDLKIGLLKTDGSVRLKVGKGITNASGGTAANVSAASLIIEGGDGGIGAGDARIYANLSSAGTLTARARDSIYLDETSGNLNIESVYSQSGDVSLKAENGSIVDALNNGWTKIQANSIDLTALNGGIGETGDYLEIDAGSAGVLKASAAGYIGIEESAGNMNLDRVASSAGDVDLKANLSILDSHNDLLADVSARDLSLSAGGNIGVIGNDLDLAVTGLLTTSSLGNSYLVQALKNLSLNTVQTGNAATAFLTAAAGSILNGRTSGANVTSGAAWLFASVDIGSKDKAVSTLVGSIQGATTSGSAWIFNAAPLTLGGDNGLLAFSGKGSLTITADCPITVIDDIIQSGTITLDAVDVADAGDDLTVQSGVTVQSTAGNVNLYAGDNLSLQGGSFIKAAGAVTISGDYRNADARQVVMDILGTVTGSSMVVTGSVDDATAITIANVTTQASVTTYAAADTVTIRAASAATSIDTGAGNDTINLGSATGGLGGITARVTLVGGAGTDTLNLDGSGAAADGSGILRAAEMVGFGMTAGVGYGTVENLNLRLGSGNDTLTVENTGATTNLYAGSGSDTVNIQKISAATNLDSGAGSDTINVGSQAGLGGFNVGLGNLNGISARLTVTGAGENDVLNLDDTGDGSANSGTLRSGEVVGLGMFAGIGYGTLETVNIRLGSGDDSFIVESTNLGASNLDMGAGADTVNVLGVSGATTVSGGAGNDTINVLGASAALTVNGDDGNDSINIRFLGATADVNAGAGDDTINVGGNAGPWFFTGAGNLNAITGRLTVSGDGGSDTLNLDATGNVAAISGALGAAEITGLGMGGGVAYDTLEALDVRLGSGNDTMTVSGTASGTATAIRGEGGNDTVTVTGGGGPTSPLVLFGDAAASETLVGTVGNNGIDASASTAGVTIYGGQGDDQIHGSQGTDHIGGGAGIDHIYGGAGNDIIYGDSSFDIDLPNRTLTVVTTGAAGNDTIVAGSGNNVIFGDHGMITQTAGTTMLLTTGNLIQATSVNGSVGGDDIITSGNGNNIVIGGFGKDNISTGSGNDVILGDNGEANFSAGVITSFKSLIPAVGDVDTITSGDGSNIILGGTGADQISGGTGADIVVGDNGSAGFKAGVLTSIQTSDPGTGGDDVINTYGGSDVVMGGDGADTINAAGNIGDSSSDRIIGDNGSFTFTDSGAMLTATTNLSEVGGADTITTDGGDSMVLGGYGQDRITTGGGNDVILGDNGRVTFVGGKITGFFTTDTNASTGDVDTINAGDGNNVIAGGIGGDGITTGGGSDVILGDNGKATFDSSTGNITSFETTDTTTSTGGIDIIEAGDGSNVIAGGIGGDGITTGGGSDVILGDNGQAFFSGGVITSFNSLNPAIGDVDTITAGDGNNIILGGAGADKIYGGKDVDIVVGDNGSAGFMAGVLTSIQTSDPDYGGDDIINTYGGSDVVMGGAGSDTINASGNFGDASSDRVIGDNGIFTFTDSGAMLAAATYLSDGGGADNITTDGGDSMVLGGYGADRITTGGGSDIILGDNGSVTFDGGKIIGFFTTDTDASTGGIDTILAGEGSNVIAGGIDGDFITAGSGDDILLGDNGSASFTTLGVLTQIKSTNADLGGADTIVAGDGNNTVIGGFGKDGISAGSGNDVILGDNGSAVFDGGTGKITSFITTDTTAGTGDIDTIKAGDGINVIAGGMGGDFITTGSGDDILLGDNGSAGFTTLGVLTKIESTNDALGGDDAIVAGDGTNTVIGGFGIDGISTGSGNDVIVGDSGEADFSTSGVITFITSQSPAIGDVDTITAGDGNNIILGGAGADQISGGKNADIVVGDNGNAVFTEGVLTSIQTSDPDYGGGDTILAGEGSNVILGGVGIDGITTGSGDDVILGDNGKATFDGSTGHITSFETTDTTISTGGIDTILAGEGSNVIAGGIGGDNITTGSGSDVILGDNGKATFDGSTGHITSFETTDTTTSTGGIDIIKAGDGSNVIAGGIGADNITTGSGSDVILGDNGQAFFSGGVITSFNSLNPAIGDVDTITAGDGNNIILGGAGADKIYGGKDVDIVVGDNGSAGFTAGVLTSIQTSDPDYGGDDIISTYGGSDVVMGGAGSDTINASGNIGDASSDRVIGDNGIFTFTDSGTMLAAATYLSEVGGSDTITTDGGDSIVLGGYGLDRITTGGGNDVILGDNGRATFVGGKITGFFTTDTDASTGGIDTILAGDGNNVIAGGIDGDLITTGSGDDILLGDNGSASFTTLGVLTQIKSTNADLGGADTIVAGDGNNTVIGGFGKDGISTGSGNDVILGDNGSAGFDGGTGKITSFITTDTTAGTGDIDTIKAGEGINVIAGGMGSDFITTGSGDDILLGDNGSATFTMDGVLTQIESTNDDLGGADTIVAGDGINTVIGGFGKDGISTGSGSDVILGDNGSAGFDGGTGKITSFFTTDTDASTGDVDEIEAGNGNNVTAGGMGGDFITTGSGNDILLGDNGSATFTKDGVLTQIKSTNDDLGGADTIVAGGGTNTVIGGSGKDGISTGSGNDVIVGDSGEADFSTAGVITFIASQSPAIGDIDTITAGDGNNIILGGVGADQISGGKDSDIIVGDSGNAGFTAGILTSINTSDSGDGGDDVINTYGGSDVVMGGAGSDTINAAGNIGDTSNDRIIGDNGSFTFTGSGAMLTATTNLSEGGGDDSINTDGGDSMVLGGYGKDGITTGGGNDVILGDNGAVAFDSNTGKISSFFTTDTAASTGDVDKIEAGNGNNVIVGGMGGDFITTGAGDDILLGDNGSASFTKDGVLTQIKSTNDDLGGADTIVAGDGINTVIGGFGKDGISTGSGSDVIVGDSGEADFSTAGVITFITSQSPEIGDIDTITSGDGNNIILGGAGADQISGGKDSDIIVGDSGNAGFTAGILTSIQTSDPDYGGDDVINTYGGSDVVMGGAGSDTINAAGTASDTSSDRIIGDNGSFTFTGSGAMLTATTNISEAGGADTITTDGGDSMVLGGYGQDGITTGGGNDVILGDNGAVAFDSNTGKISSFFTTDTAASTGDVDKIEAGNGNNVIAGGMGGDFITTGVDDDILLGDNGSASFTKDGVLTQIKSTNDDLGGADTIVAGGGTNTVIGGFGKDGISTGSGNDVIVGDSGEADFSTAGVITFITSQSPAIGDIDTITSGDGNNIILGGAGADQISGGKDSDIIVGDSGNAGFTAGILTSIQTSDPDYGGDDVINTYGGSDVVMGGAGSDTINAAGTASDTSSDRIIGDNGSFTFTGSGAMLTATTNISEAGGADTITTDGGDSMVLGGYGQDGITTGGGNDVILGDNGAVAFDSNTGKISSFFTTDTAASTGDVDKIEAGNGNNVIAGGMGGDFITTGVDDDILLGDNGSASFTKDGVLTQIKSTNDDLGGADTIVAGGGTNTVIGGFGKDGISTGSGNDVIVGDSGEADFSTAGVITFITSQSPAIGDIDNITSGDGNNIILGGAGADQISGGKDSDIIVGDSGNAGFTAGILTSIQTSDPDYGGGDTILAGEGSNVILGGVGIDGITTGSGNDVILGDNGVATFDGGTGRITGFTTTDTTGSTGGVDTINAGDGNNVVAGGVGGDVIVTGIGDDIILGDNGTVTYDTTGFAWIKQVTSTMTTLGGDDKITAGNGINTVLGGFGTDTVAAGNGTNVILGDSGEITYRAADTLQSITSTAVDQGGDDTVTAGDGSNTVLGGFGVDTVNAGLGAVSSNVILGDNGELLYDASGVLQTASTTDTTSATGGDDVVTLGNGDNLVLGGMGDDTAKVGDGNNTILGDNGTVAYETTGPAWLAQLTSTVTTLGGDDKITAGNGINTILGGFGTDTVAAGNGTNVILGDSGEIKYRAAGILQSITSTSLDQGGNDSVTAGVGNNTVLGGFGADKVTAGFGADSSNVVLGDNGQLLYDANGVLQTASSTDTNPATGRGDVIILGNGDNLVLGGLGNDTITVGNGSSTILGDNGTVSYVTTGPVFIKAATTSETTLGGDDSITAGSGTNSILGGFGNDQIRVGNGSNVILGDDGGINFGAAGKLGSITCAALDQGGNDTVIAGFGNNTIIGGSGADTVTAGLDAAGSNVVLGDRGALLYDASGVLRSVRTDDTISATGGNDSITLGSGDNLAFGGVGNDTIKAGDGSNTVLGDNGTVTYVTTGPVWVKNITSTETTLGGDDVITAGSGANTILGGFGNDNVVAGNGINVVIGDNGAIRYSAAGTLQSITSTALDLGGADTVTAGIGDNTIVGGFGADTIRAGLDSASDSAVRRGADLDLIRHGAGSNVVLGDNGELLYDAAGVLITASTTDTNSFTGAGDLITVGDGQNLVFGGMADDVIAAGTGSNILLGDNGTMSYLQGGKELTSALVKDTLPGLGGNDVITSGDGNDVLIGGFGTDTLNPGGGNDILVGDHGTVSWELGQVRGIESTYLAQGSADTLVAGAGNNIMIGGAGNDAFVGDRSNDLMIGDSGKVTLKDGMVQTVVTSNLPNDMLTFSTHAMLHAPAETEPVNAPEITVGTLGSDSLRAPEAPDLAADSGDLAQRTELSFHVVTTMPAHLRERIIDFFQELEKDDGPPTSKAVGPISNAADSLSADLEAETADSLSAGPRVAAADAPLVGAVAAAGTDARHRLSAVTATVPMVAGEGQAGASEEDRLTLGGLIAGYTGWNVVSTANPGRKTHINRESFSQLERKERNQRFKKW